MEDFKIFLMQLVETIEWQDPENCKSAAKNIMDNFSEKVGNMSRSIISGIYNDLYAGVGLFLVYMIYCIFSIINGLFDCMGDNGSIIGWTVVIIGVLLLLLI